MKVLIDRDLYTKVFYPYIVGDFRRVYQEHSRKL